MFSVIRGLYCSLFGKRNYRVLVVGLYGAGKSTFVQALCERFRGAERKNVIPTIGLDMESIAVLGKNMTLWDLGGMEEFLSGWKNFYPEAEGLVFVVDSSDRETVSRAKEIFGEVMKEKELSGIPIVVICNKSDLYGGIEFSVFKTIFHPFFNNRDAGDTGIFSVSSLSGEGADEAMGWVSKRIHHKK
ncbi:MAG: ADP-ribosylation factor-related protein [Amphiamblys sp. WSBS2006]|nr:MAG: ADP-ribosylation factor-related protein [Amphiamblys sp. WSBS2006]